MDGELQRLVLERIEADDALDDDAALLVVAACEGTDALAQALASTATVKREALPLPTSVARVGAFLDSVTVQGFRGIGPPSSLPLAPGPGLTLVVGRNGSGKSSFAEALEVLFTGDNRRWASRAAVWKDGWRNLHHGDNVSIEVGVLARGGMGRASVRRTWAVDAPIDEGESEVHQHGMEAVTLDAFGWQQALANYRPFLSYNELGSLLDDGPSRLYDALSAILGLDELVQAQRVIGDARKEREKGLVAIKKQLPALLAELEGVDDDRAVACQAALSRKPWDLDTAEAVVLGLAEGVDERSRLEVLRGLAALEAPITPDQAIEMAAALRRAQHDMDEIATTAAADAQQIADLLERSHAFHERHGNGDCPVCGASHALDDAWRAESEERIRTLRERAQKAQGVENETKELRRRAAGVLRGVPTIVGRAGSVELDSSELAREWSGWAAGPTGSSLDALATHIEGRAAGLSQCIQRLRDVAHEAIDTKQEAWTPMRRALDAWISGARAAEAEMRRVPTVKAAEAWLKATSEDLRDQRFAPIADEAARIWELLRTTSNVELSQIRLKGAGNRRHVTLDVQVDGVGSAALGVMSQGELHSLALSLFFPRALLPESPFGFVIIDDPVQSMDPARVDGLAHVLDEVARRRQVIVFTHDDRLPASVRDLGIDATILEVSRRPGSVVELRRSLDPVARYLDDARALALTGGLPAEVGGRAVPGYCRAALEAACVEVYRRRSLQAGVGHDSIEDTVAEAKTLTKLASLGLFDDPNRGGDVLARLNKFGGWAGDTFQECNRATHVGAKGDLADLIKNTERLADKIRGVK